MPWLSSDPLLAGNIPGPGKRQRPSADLRSGQALARGRRSAPRGAAGAPSRARQLGRPGRRRRRLERLLEDALDLVDEDELDAARQVFRELVEVGLVQLRRDHALDARALSRERL